MIDQESLPLIDGRQPKPICDVGYWYLINDNDGPRSRKWLRRDGQWGDRHNSGYWPTLEGARRFARDTASHPGGNSEKS